jgi:3-hydroxyisobutyrate dehydrogenase
MTKVGFIGLGLIGSPMCSNLVKAGHEVTVWNRTPGRIVPLVKTGAAASTSAREVAERSVVTFTAVSDSPDVEEVILGENGVIEGAAPDSVVVDISTISPSVTRNIAQRLAAKGVHMLDAPVSGGVGGAETGTLSIMAGGDRAIFDRCLPLFQTMGKQITYCGANGMGQVTKLANQIAGLGTMAAMCEALVFAASNGGDLEAVLGALDGGAASSWMVKNLGPAVLRGDFDPGFMVKLALKDLRLVLESAAEAEMPLFTTSLVAQVFRSAQRAGLGDSGIQAYAKVLESLAGVEARTG